MTGQKLYQLFRPILFRMNPELAHNLALKGIEAAYRLGISGFSQKHEKTVMGIRFTNPVGLAAGFDKNGRYIDPLISLGFGFIEIGTLTPRPQPGNPRPRVFRIGESEALINRMGFNNDGVEKAIFNLKHTHYNGVIGISIGKNADTPIENAETDYVAAFQQVYPFASYVAVNISSPGTRDLRQLQEPDHLTDLLRNLKTEQSKLAIQYDKYVPLVIKLAPDFNRSQLNEICDILLVHYIDGIIATNTTLSRNGVEGSPCALEPGGLSGAPLRKKATEVLLELNNCLRGKIPIIASGGIMSADDAIERIKAGASLVQLYTGFIYQGPILLRNILKRFSEIPISGKKEK